VIFVAVSRVYWTSNSHPARLVAVSFRTALPLDMTADWMFAVDKRIDGGTSSPGNKHTESLFRCSWAISPPTGSFALALCDWPLLLIHPDLIGGIHPDMQE
jgi:hypothetical protein